MGHSFKFVVILQIGATVGQTLNSDWFTFMDSSTVNSFHLGTIIEPSSLVTQSNFNKNPFDYIEEVFDYLKKE